MVEKDIAIAAKKKYAKRIINGSCEKEVCFEWWSFVDWWRKLIEG